MNLELYSKLMEKRTPHQHPSEWLMFLEICEIYLKRRGIENPIVVELGVSSGGQKRFYEQLLGAHHIGIDISSKQNNPDILGDTHDSETLKVLKEKLKGESINILFIDADHTYKSVKQDFEMYSPLCNNIIAFHDIETLRHLEGEGIKVWKFWDELRLKIYKGEKEYKNFLFLSIFQYRGIKDKKQFGIGMIIKNKKEIT